MAILEPGIAQRLVQCVCIELRIVTGSRNGADIDEKTDLMGAQQAYEFIDRSRRVAESPDCRWQRHGSVWHDEQGIATGSIRRQFLGIDFEQSQSAVGDVLGFVEAIAKLYGSDEEIAAGHKREVAL
jgi:hypothetical protein